METVEGSGTALVEAVELSNSWKASVLPVLFDGRFGIPFCLALPAGFPETMAQSTFGVFAFATVVKLLPSCNSSQ